MGHSLNAAAIAIGLSLAISFSALASAGDHQSDDPNPNHPGEVALGNDAGKWSYKSFPALLPLYIFEGDTPGKSNCDVVCAAVWPIIRAPDEAMPTGDWTIVQRSDGRRQWAYKGMPVYTYYDDRPFEPKGDGLVYGWWLRKDTASVSKPEGKRKLEGWEGKPAWRLLVP